MHIFNEDPMRVSKINGGFKVNMTFMVTTEPIIISDDEEKKFGHTSSQVPNQKNTN
jgi:hypothetical protein